LTREAVRSYIRELDDLVGDHLRKIRNITPDWQDESKKIAASRRDVVKAFLRTRRLPVGWRLADADTLPDRIDLNDVFIAGDTVRDRIRDEIARDARVAAEAKQALYLDATTTKTKLLVYADPAVVADMEKLRLHDYIEAARQKLGVKVLAAAKE
jgi:hypothetical protein